MQNLAIIFENSLFANKDKNGDFLENLAFNLALQGTQKSLSELFCEFLSVLKRLEMLDESRATRLVKALIRAKNHKHEQDLYALINEKNALNTKIAQQKERLKNEVSKGFFELSQSLESSHFGLANSLNDAFLFELETLDILRETTESALIYTLERGEDIELTASAICKDLIYNVCNEANFAKESILRASQIILNTAFELANESKNFAKPLCVGVISGTQDGIELGVEKFKTSFKFCVLEEDLTQKEKQLLGLEDEFIALLRDFDDACESPVKDILHELLGQQLDTLFAKFKRVLNESREQLILSLNELRKMPKKTDLQSKITLFRKEINDLEHAQNTQYKDFNAFQAKKLGKSLWEKAKKLISLKNNE